eukprot:scaffold14647_cov60-Phaeocystis_antarctica.AAC.10
MALPPTGGTVGSSSSSRTVSTNPLPSCRSVTAAGSRAAETTAVRTPDTSAPAGEMRRTRIPLRTQLSGCG